MANPEIRPMMTAIDMYFDVDFEYDGDIDAADFAVFANCLAGPDVTTVPEGCTPAQFAGSDLDDDDDVDLRDAAIFQTLFAP